jgi:hypothetical protein
MKLRSVIFITCIIVILAMGGTARGDSAKPDDSKKIIGTEGIGKEMFTAVSPWPNERCYADRQGRSDYQGPGTNLYESLLIDLHNLGLESTSGAWFGNLRVGPGNSIYFTYNVNMGERRLCSYNLTDGIVWQEECEVASDPGLDGYGNVYYIDGSGRDLVCRRPGGEIKWQVTLPEAAMFTTFRVMTVGDRIYVDADLPGWDYFFAVGKNGQVEATWEYDGLWIRNVAEDSSGNFYLGYHRLDTDEGLYKIDKDGNELWHSLLELPGITPYPSADYSDRGPILLNDGRICGTKRDSSFEGLSSSEQPYYVVNGDGSLLKSGYLGQGRDPYYVCYGKDGKLYISHWGMVACYDNFAKAWETHLPGAENFESMVMDTDGLIYGVSLYYLTVVDPMTGELVTKLRLSDSAPPSPYHNLAIGDDRHLFWLNSRGYLTVFAPKLEISPKFMKQESGEVKREILK